MFVKGLGQWLAGWNGLKWLGMLEMSKVTGQYNNGETTERHGLTATGPEHCTLCALRAGWRASAAGADLLLPFRPE